MRWEKRVLGWPLTRAVARGAMRLYRTFVFGGYRFRHDPALVGLLRTREPVLFGVWHQDFAFTLGYLSRWNRRRMTYALASSSRDGGLAASVAEGVGFQRPIRGSSARGGLRALRQMVRLLRRKPQASLAIVCDGPRPPAQVMQPGLAYLASHTGRPIWLVRTSYRPVRVLRRTWARFHIPHVHARAIVVADGPIHVPPGLDRAGLERWRHDLEERLNRLVDRADRAVS